MGPITMIQTTSPTVRHGALIIPVAPEITTMIATIILALGQLKMLLEIGLPILQPKVVHGQLKIQQKMPKVVGPVIVLTKLRVVGAKKILRTDGVVIIPNRVLKVFGQLMQQKVIISVRIIILRQVEI